MSEATDERRRALHLCPVCVEPVIQHEGRGRPRLFCSTPCLKAATRARVRVRNRPVPSPCSARRAKQMALEVSERRLHRFCAQGLCLALVQPKGPQHIYCGKPCQKRAEHERRASRDGRIYGRQAERPCAGGCGRMLTPGAHDTRLRRCPDCQRSAVLEAKLNSRRSRGVQSRRRMVATRRLAAAARGTVGSATWVAGPCACASCRKLFVFNQPQAIVCSPDCFRRHCTGRDHRQRARRYGVAYERIRSVDIFERDRWICGICKRIVDRRQAVPHPDAPTLDHIIPMSKGGPHLRANVQCAHFMCNSVKGDRVPGHGEQLRLVG